MAIYVTLLFCVFSSIKISGSNNFSVGKLKIYSGNTETKFTHYIHKEITLPIDRSFLNFSNLLNL